MRLPVALAALVLAAALVPAAAAIDPSSADAQKVAGAVQGADPSAAGNPARALDPITGPQAPVPNPPGTPPGGVDPGFAGRIRAAFQDSLMMAGVAALALSTLGLAGFALVSRYISPKEA